VRKKNRVGETGPKGKTCVQQIHSNEILNSLPERKGLNTDVSSTVTWGQGDFFRPRHDRVSPRGFPNRKGIRTRHKRRGGGFGVQGGVWVGGRPCGGSGEKYENFGANLKKSQRYQKEEISKRGSNALQGHQEPRYWEGNGDKKGQHKTRPQLAAGRA